MDKDIKVTIYCCTYNHEKYIRDALEGFVKQKTNFAFEVLVHDDASTDSTAKIIKEYEEKYPEIIIPIFQHENQYSKGKSIVYEYLLPRTKGKYIAVCEGDDYWTCPNKLQMQYDYMENNENCSLTAGKTMILEMQQNVLRNFTNYDFEANHKYDFEIEDIIVNQLLFHTSTMFYKKKYYIKNYEFLQTIKGYDYVMKILLSAEGMVHIIPEVLSVYRKGTENSWTQNVQRNEEKYIQHLEEEICNLQKIDEYKKYRFHDIFQTYIEKRTVYMWIESKNIDKIDKEMYQRVFSKLSMKEKIILTLKRYPMFMQVIREMYFYFIKFREFLRKENRE